MGNSSQKLKFDINSAFSKVEIEHLKNLYLKEFNLNKNNQIENSVFNYSKFVNDIFLGVDNQLSSCLVEVGLIKPNEEAKSYEDYLNLIHFFYKAVSDDKCLLTKAYYNKTYSSIIYDCLVGKVNSSEDYFSKENTNKFLAWIFSAYLNVVHQMNSKITKINITEEIEEFISIIPTFKSINDLHTYFYNLDSFICGYIRALFLCESSHFSLSHPMGIPIPSEKSKTLSYSQFFIYCLKNPQLFSKQYAYKLFDCSDSGFNLSNIIYSFLGFPNQVLILIHDFDKKTGKDSVIGMFLNSNFKECYESYCGDEFCSIFTFEKDTGIQIYDYIGNNNSNILMINIKNNKYSKRLTGIGLGDLDNESRVWIDGDELFKKSYFTNYDTVFKEGSIYTEDKHYLNVSINIILSFYIRN